MPCYYKFIIVHLRPILKGILPWQYKLTWFSKTDETISANQFKQVIQSAQTFLAYFEILRIPDDGRKRNLEGFFTLFLSRNLRR